MIEKQNPKFLSLFLPRKFKATSPLNFLVLSKNKDEIEVESKHFPFLTELQDCDLFRNIENRFWLYDRSPALENLHYSFYYQKKDSLNKNILVFSRKKREIKKNVSQKQLYNCVKFSNIEGIKGKLFKSRILSLKKKDFSLSFYGKKTSLKNTLFFPGKRKQSSDNHAKINILKSLRFYGFLNLFLVKDWDLDTYYILDLEKEQSYVKIFKNDVFYSSSLRVLPKKTSIHQLLIKK